MRQASRERQVRRKQGEHRLVAFPQILIAGGVQSVDDPTSQVLLRGQQQHPDQVMPGLRGDLTIRVLHDLDFLPNM